MPGWKSGESARKPLSALIIEESETAAKLIVRELLRAGYRLDFARVSEMGALDAALKRRAWDVVTCASSLPGCSLEDALAAVKKMQPHAPFIVVSAAASEASIVDALRRGANDYVLKSNLARLAPAVDRELLAARERGAERRPRTLVLENDESIQLLIERVLGGFEDAALSDVLEGLLRIDSREQFDRVMERLRSAIQQARDRNRSPDGAS